MRRSLSQYSAVVLGVLWLLGMAGCAVERGKVYVKDGTTYGVVPGLTWRGRWWNYYQRGLSYAAGEFWQEAIADLQTAIAQRQADQRDARTYGLHFLDYFPHRELGVVYYRLGRQAEAIRELETSLATVDSAKAKFYLNRARREELRRTGRDAAPPRLVLDSPAPGLWTNRHTVTVTGRAEDDAYVAAVTIHGEALFIELAEPRLPFAQEVTLTDGPNVVEVLAVDLLGRTTREHLTVHVDRRGPLLSLESLEVLDEPGLRRVRVAGLITDDSPVRRFLLAGRAMPVPAESTWEFRHEVALAADTAVLPFEAEDAAGNVTRGRLALSSTPETPPGIREGKPTFPLPLSPSPPLPIFLPRWASLHLGTVVSDLVAPPPAPQRMALQPEGDAPTIRLKELATQTIYDDKLYLDGEVRAASAIVAFSINGESQLQRFPPGRERRRIFFGELLPLGVVGENRFRLEVTDATGRTTRREVVVQRQVQKVRQREARLRIAVLPLEQSGTTAGLSDMAYDHLLAAFDRQGRFRLLERERERLEDILREHRLSQTPHVDRVTAVKTGKIVAVEGVLFGTVSQPAPQTLEVSVRFVDVETTELLATADVYGEELEPRDVEFLMQGLAWKFKQRFPLVEGVVVEREGERVFVNRGSQHALKQFMKAILFRDGKVITDPQTGTRLGYSEEPLGEARITEVADAFSQAVLLPSAQARDVRKLDVKKLDKFITK